MPIEFVDLPNWKSWFSSSRTVSLPEGKSRERPIFKHPNITLLVNYIPLMSPWYNPYIYYDNLANPGYNQPNYWCWSKDRFLAMGTVFWGLLGGIWNEKWIHPQSFHHGFCIQCSLFKNGPFKVCNTLKAMVTWGSPISKNTLLQKPLVTRWLGNLSLNKTASTWLFTSLTYSSTNNAVERGHSFLVFIIVRCMSLYIYHTHYTHLYTLYTHMYYVYLCVIITIQTLP